MSDYIIRIDPGHMPRLVESPEYLTSAHIESIVEGDYIFGVPHHDLKAKYPALSLIYNADGDLFELPSNEWATRLHKVVDSKVLGSAIVTFAKNGVPYPLTAVEATDIRDTIEQLYEIEFEEDTAQCE